MSSITPLLASKLYIPRAQPNRVARPRLYARLNAAHALTLLCAPPGFGKTTLLGEWIPSQAQCVCWLSLDDGDSDPVRFWTYFIAALQTLNEKIGATALALLQAPQPLPLESALNALLNDVAAFPDRFVLVLDDYHVITAPPIHDSLAFVIDHLPPRMQIIITSRIDPPLPLARWRARGRLGELRAADLRFTPDETAAFLNGVMGLHLIADEVAALEQHTEGWITGLQLAALSMQGRSDAAGFIASFTGSHRFILDYLVEEVLDRQPPATLRFLLHTSILDRLCGSVCDALTDQSDSQSLLEQLEHANLFITPLDDRREWFRYHHLFADVLRARLRATQPEVVPALHRCASEWHEQHGPLTEAISHASKANDIDRVAALIERAAPTWLETGTIRTLRGWLESLPEAVVHARPRLYLIYVVTLAQMGEVSDLDARLDKADQLVRASEALTVVERNDLLGEITALRARATINRNELPEADDLQTARAMVSAGNTRIQALLALALGHTQRLKGDLAQAARYFAQAAAFAQQRNDKVQTVYTLGFLADLQEIQGHLHEAAETHRQALQLATAADGTRLPVAGTAVIGLGNLYREWNDLAQAEQYLGQGLEIGQQSGVEAVELYSALALALVRQAQGDADEADGLIRRAAAIAQKWRVPSTMLRVGAFEARLRLMRGQWQAADGWAQANSIDADARPDAQLEVEHCTLARVLIARRKLDDAKRLLDRLLAVIEPAGRLGRVIEVLTLQTLALRVQGDKAAARSALERALTLAEPAGYIRTFVDEGEPLRLLIADFRLQSENRNDHLKAYLEKLLAAFPSAAAALRDSQIRNQQSAITDLIEPLSERELEVLRLIAEGLSNREIAARLIVGTGTVKTHINNIYRKLDVNSRTRALHHARELSLLE